jgi:hypothetical protein
MWGLRHAEVGDTEQEELDLREEAGVCRALHLDVSSKSSVAAQQVSRRRYTCLCPL